MEEGTELNELNRIKMKQDGDDRDKEREGPDKVGEGSRPGNLKVS